MPNQDVAVEYRRLKGGGHKSYSTATEDTEPETLVGNAESVNSLLPTTTRYVTHEGWKAW